MGSAPRQGALAPTSGTWITSLEQLDVICLYLDGCGEVALFEVYEEAFVFAASLTHQAAFEAVELTADEADLLAIDLG